MHFFLYAFLKKQITFSRESGEKVHKVLDPVN